MSEILDDRVIVHQRMELSLCGGNVIFDHDEGLVLVTIDGMTEELSPAEVKKLRDWLERSTP